jgi:hypothetical protein
MPKICDGDVTIISIFEWRDIVRKGDLIWHLTEAGLKRRERSHDPEA